MNPSDLPAFLQPRSVRAVAANNHNAQSVPTPNRPTAAGSSSDEDEDNEASVGGNQLDFGVNESVPQGDALSPSERISPGYRPPTDVYAPRPQHVHRLKTSDAKAIPLTSTNASTSSSGSGNNDVKRRRLRVSCGTGTDTYHEGAGGYGSLSDSPPSPSSPFSRIGIGIIGGTSSPKKEAIATQTTRTTTTLTTTTTVEDLSQGRAEKGQNGEKGGEREGMDFGLGDEDNDLPADFDEMLLAEDDPNEDDEQYRMRMADELAPVCEGMTHEEIVDLLDDYAQQRKERRAAFLTKKAEEERRASLMKIVVKRSGAPAVQKSDSENYTNQKEDAASEDQDTHDQSNREGEAKRIISETKDTARENNDSNKNFLGALMFGEVDAHIAATSVAPPPTLTTKASSTINLVINTAAEGSSSKELNTKVVAAPQNETKVVENQDDAKNDAGAAFYNPRVAEERMRQQLSDLLGEFEANRKVTTEEALRRQRESAGGILSAQRSVASSRLSAALASASSSSGHLAEKKGRVGGADSGFGLTTKAYGANYGIPETQPDNDDEDDDLLCVTGSGGEIKMTGSDGNRTPSVLQKQQMKRAAVNRQNGAMSSEGGNEGRGGLLPFSQAEDKAFRAKAKAILSVPRQAPEAHNTSNNVSEPRRATRGSEDDVPLTRGRVALAANQITAKSAALRAAAITSTTSSSTPIPLPPASALAMPPAPSLSSEAGRRIALSNAALNNNGSKPAVPRQLAKGPAPTTAQASADSGAFTPMPPPSVFKGGNLTPPASTQFQGHGARMAGLGGVQPSAPTLTISSSTGRSTQRNLAPTTTTTGAIKNGAGAGGLKSSTRGNATQISAPLSVGGFTFLKKA